MTAVQSLLASAGALVFFVPMNLLAFYTAVQGVPTAVVDCFCFTVVAPLLLLCFRDFLPVPFLQLCNFLFASLFVSGLVLLQVCPHAFQHCAHFLQLLCFTLFLDLFPDLLHEVLLLLSVLGLQLFPMFPERLPILGVTVALRWGLFQAWHFVYSSKHLSVCLR